MKDWFRKFANKVSGLAGSAQTFGLSIIVILTWAALGPRFDYSDTWQLVINTSTSLITFLMVFLIQNTQNRDARALHLKLDELIRANTRARNSLIDLQSLTDQELDTLHQEFSQLNSETAKRLEQIKHRLGPNKNTQNQDLQNKKSE